MVPKRPKIGHKGLKYSFIRILTGSDLSSRRLAVMEMKGKESGPTLWLTGCVHGDEVGGIVIIQEVFKRLTKEGLLAGKILAFPLMNPIGFENNSRHLSPSQEDLNRSFPGQADGTLAERLADTIFSYIKNTKPSLVLDLHNDWLASIPYTLIDPNPGTKHKEAYDQAKTFARVAGFPIVDEEEENLTEKEELQKSLSG
jgi:predicted deacylase